MIYLHIIDLESKHTWQYERWIISNFASVHAVLFLFKGSGQALNEVQDASDLWQRPVKDLRCWVGPLAMKGWKTTGLVLVAHWCYTWPMISTSVVRHPIIVTVHKTLDVFRAYMWIRRRVTHIMWKNQGLNGKWSTHDWFSTSMWFYRRVSVPRDCFKICRNSLCFMDLYGKTLVWFLLGFFPWTNALGDLGDLPNHGPLGGTQNDCMDPSHIELVGIL